jgi:hypothetical protein
MFNVQPLMILSLQIFITTENSGHSSKDALKPLIVAICPSLHLLSFKVYQNQKGFLSQNYLFIHNYTMLFTYILTGWEGSTTNSHAQ